MAEAQTSSCPLCKKTAGHQCIYCGVTFYGSEWERSLVEHQKRRQHFGGHYLLPPRKGLWWLRKSVFVAKPDVEIEGNEYDVDPVVGNDEGDGEAGALSDDGEWPNIDGGAVSEIAQLELDAGAPEDGEQLEQDADASEGDAQQAALPGQGGADVQMDELPDLPQSLKRARVDDRDYSLGAKYDGSEVPEDNKLLGNFMSDPTFRFLEVRDATDGKLEYRCTCPTPKGSARAWAATHGSTSNAKKHCTKAKCTKLARDGIPSVVDLIKQNKAESDASGRFLLHLVDSTLPLLTLRPPSSLCPLAHSSPPNRSCKHYSTTTRRGFPGPTCHPEVSRPPDCTVSCVGSSSRHSCRQP
jgi:hypothetical protein